MAALGRYLVLVAIAYATPVAALACGHCDGDKEAAVYSHADRAMAARTGNPYVVVEFVGVASKEQLKRAELALKGVTGVVGSSVRVAYEQRSAAFVHKRDVPIETIHRQFQKSSGGASFRVLPGSFNKDP